MLSARWTGSEFRIVSLATRPALVVATVTESGKARTHLFLFEAGLQSETIAVTGPAATITLSQVPCLKAAPKTLYVSRPPDAEEFIDWAAAAGFKKTVAPDDLHVTIIYSKAAVDWDTIPPAGNRLRVRGGARKVQPLGKEGAVVLHFESGLLQRRWREVLELGARSDYDSFKPHVTITYDGGDIDLSGIEPFRGELVFGRERFASVEENWTDDIKETAT